MRIDILTTHHRSCDQVDKFWRSYGWQPVYHDNTGLPPGTGRNRILEEFYSSGRSWLAIADDDVYLDIQRGNAIEFLSDPNKLLSKLNDEIASFGVMNNIHHRVDITLSNPALKDNWVFLRNYWIGCLMFHRNTGNKYKFHPTDVLEDMDWCIEQLLDHQRVATCMNLVMKNLGAKSSLFTTQQQRRESYIAAKQRIANSYPGITLTDKGKLLKTKLINSHWPNSPRWQSVKNIGPSLVISRD